jgi:glycosyl transferase family 25
MNEAPLFNVLNNRFDHVYVITLKRSEERHARFGELLGGLNYEIFWGVDGDQLDLDKLKIEKLYDPELAMKKYPIGRELVPGEIGCALSHIGVYKDLLAKGYRNALILEDDINFDADATSELKKSLAQLPNDWELLYL